RDHPFGRSPIDGTDLSRLASLTGVPLDAPNTGAELIGSQVSFTRPELSPCLAGLPDNDPRRQEALAIIQKGSRNLRSRPREDMSACETPCGGHCDSQTAQRGIAPVGNERTAAHQNVGDQNVGDRNVGDQNVGDQNVGNGRENKE
ncbi:MAG: pentapeptide repeat-containing protein, partial [Patescibacteria group bacterium]|nr:pentapeptide repeat-containing protein [Patescibacteria group bacterium]